MMTCYDLWSRVLASVGTLAGNGLVLDHSISGTVVGRDGTPVTAAMITAFEGGAGADEILVPVRTTYSRNDGTFTIDGLRRRAYVLQASHPGFVDIDFLVVVADSHVRLELETAATVAGRVLDDRGEPVADYVLRLCERTRGRTRIRSFKIHNQRGQFEVQDVRAGELDIEAKAPSGESGAAGIRVAQRTRADVTIRVGR